MILVSTSFIANKSLEEIRSLLFQLKDEVFSGSGFKGTLLNVRERSKKLEELFENEIGSALLSSVSKPRLAILMFVHQWVINNFITEL